MSAARKPTNTAQAHQHGPSAPVGKAPVLSLVERDGSVRSFHVANVTAQTLRPIIVTHVNKASYLMTDDAHGLSARSGASSRATAPSTTAPRNMSAPRFWHTNTVENYFSIFKRGIVGVYHHVSELYLSSPNRDVSVFPNLEMSLCWGRAVGGRGAPAQRSARPAPAVRTLETAPDLFYRAGSARPARRAPQPTLNR